MFSDKTQSQHQMIDQDIDISQDKHGKKERISCSYYTDGIVHAAERKLNHGGIDLARKQAEAVKEMKKVDVLFFNGKVVRVFCHLLENQQCLSEQNLKGNKRCHILDEVC